MAKFLDIVKWNAVKISYFALSFQKMRNIGSFYVMHVHSLNQHDMLQQQSPASNVHEGGIC
jgi:hypothetical protein